MTWENVGAPCSATGWDVSLGERKVSWWPRSRTHGENLASSLESTTTLTFESTEEHRVVLLFQCRVEDHQHRASVGELGQDVACERKEEDEYRAHRGQNLVDDDDDDGDDVVQVVMACLARPVSRDRRPTDYLVVTRRVEATT